MVEVGNAATTGPSDDGSFCPPAQRPYVLVAAILASSMAFIDGSVLAIAIPALRADLGASLAEVQWVSNAYLLLMGSLLLLGGGLHGGPFWAGPGARRVGAHANTLKPAAGTFANGQEQPLNTRQNTRKSRLV